MLVNGFRRCASIGAVAVVGSAACASSSEPSAGFDRSTEAPTPDAGADVDAPSSTATPDVFDVPIAGITEAERAAFVAGDRSFELSLRDADGLGPLYVRSSCGSCHRSGVRGPGSVQKMAVVLEDGITPAESQAALPFGPTVRPQTTAGATIGIRPPSEAGVNVRVTIRVGPSILGRGYVEAILDSEIERVASEQAARSDAIHGRVQRVVYGSEGTTNPALHGHVKGDVVIGRFGFKAKIATLDDFTADALQGDMGITSPLRPVELPNPEGLNDDEKTGVDVARESVESRAAYVRLTAIPPRFLSFEKRAPASASADVREGKELFERVRCSVCHVPSMKTRADHPVAALARIDAEIYSDLLLHDMGPDLADGIVEGRAGSRDWRTAPLIGLRHAKTFLHDSRADTVERAIVLHGGPGSEAIESVRLYSELSAADRTLLLSFVNDL